MRDWAYQAIFDAAMALPPSDFGSHRACEAAAGLLRKERERADELLAALKGVMPLTSYGPEGKSPPDELAAIAFAKAMLARATLPHEDRT